MVAVVDVAARPRAGRALGRRLTAFNPGLIRSALAGQANAILFRSGLRLLERRLLVLHPGSLRLHRRVCQVVRLGLPDGRTLAVANVHATNLTVLAEGEVLRAAVFLEEIAYPSEVAVLAGDFNVAGTLDELVSWGFSAPGPGIDHVLVRGAESGPEQPWPREARRIGGLLVSDHAPVEVEIT
jgi:endonuclease/exonuclease/phosphatase family metal-dependent hydrolase